MRVSVLFLVIVSLILFFACQSLINKTSAEKGNYGYDITFLKKELNVVELVNGEARLVVVPKYGGRVMTSSSKGLTGHSNGWINYDLIISHQTDYYSNPYGGEERLWLGPEGGQFSVFFSKADSAGKGKWRVAPPLDHEEFSIKSITSESIALNKDFEIENRIGNKFKVRLTRTITLLDSIEISINLGFVPGKSVNVVAYQSDNCLKNIGDKAWNKECGTLSIWDLGMLKASPTVTVILPYQHSAERKIFTDYFENIPKDRVKVTGNVVLFRVDGNYRSKIGISSLVAVPCIGSYDAKQKILTVIEYSLSKNQMYVNSLLENQQNDPFSGDAVNSYNDGPHADGSQIGQVYELETSSPAAFLNPGEEITHISRMYHFEGSEEDLDIVSQSLLKVSLKEVKSAFKSAS
jgi:hypothetical protein